MTVVGHNSANRNVNSLSSSDKQKLKGIIQELDDSMTRQAAERELQKEILSKMEDEMGLNKKLVKKLAKTAHRATFKDEVEENRTFEEFYDIVMNGPISNKE